MKTSDMSTTPVDRKKKKATAKPEPATQYAWRPGSRCSVDPQVAGEEIKRIATKQGRDIPLVEPQVVVDESRDEDAALHPAFEWDDETAANLHRCETARQIVRSIRVIDEDGEIQSSPVWVAITTPETGDRGYAETTKVWTHEDLKAQVLNEAIKQLHGLRDRYQNLSELAEVFDAINRLPVAK